MKERNIKETKLYIERLKFARYVKRQLDKFRSNTDIIELSTFKQKKDENRRNM